MVTYNVLELLPSKPKLMSAFGTKADMATHSAISVIGGKADIDWTRLDVCFLTQSGHGLSTASELFCAYNGVNLAGAMRPRTWVERTSFSQTEKSMSD